MVGMMPARTLQTIAGAMAALFTVLFASLIAHVALCLDDARRQYAIGITDRFVTLAAVLVGSRSRPPATKRSAPK